MGKIIFGFGMFRDQISATQALLRDVELVCSQLGIDPENIKAEILQASSLGKIAKILNEKLDGNIVLYDSNKKRITEYYG